LEKLKLLYQMYQENRVEVDQQTAGLLMSAIISDTLLFRSPTCTPLDEKVGRELAKIAGVEIEKYALEMFSAGSDLKGKTDKEIFYQDFKHFSAGKLSFGVSQVTSLNEQELKELEPRLLRFMREAMQQEGLDMSFVMLTNILDQDTRLLAVGNGAEQLVENAFGLSPEKADSGADGASSVLLRGVVSRKKQLIPPLTLFAEQM